VRQGKRQSAKAEKLGKIRKGEKGAADTHRSADLKAASKDFYNQACSPRCTFTAPSHPAVDHPDGRVHMLKVQLRRQGASGSVVASRHSLLHLPPTVLPIVN